VKTGLVVLGVRACSFISEAWLWFRTGHPGSQVPRRVWRLHEDWVGRRQKKMMLAEP